MKIVGCGVSCWSSSQGRNARRHGLLLMLLMLPLPLRLLPLLLLVCLAVLLSLELWMAVVGWRRLTVNGRDVIERREGGGRFSALAPTIYPGKNIGVTAIHVTENMLPVRFFASNL
jgi:hypothetical protein